MKKITKITIVLITLISFSFCFMIVGTVLYFVGLVNDDLSILQNIGFILIMIGMCVAFPCHILNHFKKKNKIKQDKNNDRSNSITELPTDNETEQVNEYKSNLDDHPVEPPSN